MAKSKEHYVNNKEFLAAIIEYKENVERKMWNDEETYILREFKELEYQPFMQHLNPKFDEESTRKRICTFSGSNHNQ